jgi:hypothetical protein
VTSPEKLRQAVIAAGDAVTCSECGEQFRRWQHDLVPAHGPYSDRCPGGGKPAAFAVWHPPGTHP